MATTDAEQQETDKILKWHLYGQAPWLQLDPDREPALASSWNTEPFSKPQTASWDVPVSLDQLKGLLLGFKPKEMEGKWFVYCDVPREEDDKQITTMYQFRSWTGHRIAEARIMIEPKKSLATITQLTYETDEKKILRATEQSSKESFLSVCRYILAVHLKEA